MPAKAPPPRACGIKISTASDEAWVVSVSYFVAHSVPLIIYLVFCLSFFQVIILNNCELDLGDTSVGKEVKFSNPEQIFGASALAFLVISYILWGWVYWISTTGDIFQYAARESISIPLSILFIVNIYLIFLFGLGVYIIGDFDFDLFDLEDETCRREAKTKFSMMIIWELIILWDTVLYFLVLLLFREKAPSALIADSMTSEDEMLAKKEEWNLRCRAWCCGLRYISFGLFGSVFSKNKTAEYAFDQVSEVFGTFFSGHEATLSDLVAAILLIRAEQHAENRANAIKIWKEDEQRFDHETHHKNRLSRELSDFLDEDFSVRKYKQRVGDHYRQVLDIEEEVMRDLEGDPTAPLIPKDTKLKASESQEVLRTVKKIEHQAKSRPEFETKRSASDMIMNEENLFLFSLIKSYSPYMLGLYGWKLLVYMDAIQLRPWRNVGTLMGISSLMHPRKILVKKQKSYVSASDNCCSCQTNALLHMTDAVAENLIFASYANVEGVVTPYAVMVDHEKKSVIVGCRGTLSFRDMLTDAMLHPTLLEEYGERWGFDGRNSYAHNGMLLCAEEIRIQLQRTKILHKLLKQPVTAVVPESDPNKASAAKMKEELVEQLNVKLENIPDCTGYNLVVVGHSLGGGVASILALLLRNEFSVRGGEIAHGLEFPGNQVEMRNNFFCISYAPPGCVFDEALSKKCESFILSPVIGKDLVPHLSWLSLQKNRLKALDVLYRSKVNKRTIFSTMYRHIPISQLLYERGTVPKTPERERLKQQISKLAKRVLLFDELDENQNQEGRNYAREYIEKKVMQCPGRVIHIAQTHTEKTGCLTWKKFYKPYFIEKDDMLDYHMSMRSLLDHFPNYYAFIIDQVYDDYMNAANASPHIL